MPGREVIRMAEFLAAIVLAAAAFFLQQHLASALRKLA
jgi:hypothetical protein